MRLWSFSLGRVFGVDVRMHVFFLLLLMLSVGWAARLQVSLVRGAALWLLLLLAVAVREIARGLAAAWFRLDISGLLLLPTGGIVSYASASALARSGEAKAQRGMALAGPAANLLFALILGGVVLAVSPLVDLHSPLWVTPDHLLRTMVWLNLLLTAVNLLPAWPLDAGRLVKGEMMRASGTGKSGSQSGSQASTQMRMLATLGPAIAIALVLVGMVTTSTWAVVIGLGILLAAQVERQGVLLRTGADLVKVGEVMLTEYSILSASATLEDALVQARHTLQDVFPVVRAGNLVGAVSRGEVVEALGATGNGYVQGIMTRLFHTASPEDSLVETLGRVTGPTGMSSQLVPVLEGERIVGILTPGNLRRAMSLLAPRTEPADPRGAEDEMR